MDIMQLQTVLAWYAALERNSHANRVVVEQLRAQDEPADADSLMRAMKAVAARARLKPDRRAADQMLEWIGKHGADVVCWTDTAYPDLLRQIATPPLLLFARGDVNLLRRSSIAIVGARRASRAGREVAATLAGQLSERGITVVSGLALGIDGAAHDAALGRPGSTIAVLGCGLDVIYPRQHRGLAARIADKGLIVSEFSVGSRPMKHHFPRRNRIIAGLSLGTVVVEAAERSGSISTANHALENGREVFAVPGRVLNPLAGGCNNLIRQGARLTASIDDIVEKIPTLPHAGAANQPPSPTPGSERQAPVESKLLETCGWAQFTIDELVEGSGLTVQEVSSMLLALELDGQVEANANGTFSRIR